MKLKSLLSIATASLLLASCLKSRDAVGVIEDKGSIVSEIFDKAYYGDLKFISLDATPATETISDFLTLKVYAPRSNQPAGGSVRIKLVQDNAAVTAAGLTVLPANAYTLPASLEFDVPANGEVKIPLTLNKNNINLANSYGLGFKIAEVSGGVISDLAKNILVQIGIKNKWDGIYKIRGTGTHPNSGLSGPFEYAGCDGFTLETSGSNSVDLKPGQPTNNGGSLSYFSSVIPRFVIDANNGVTVTGGAPGNGVVFDPQPGYTNRYDPATKTFYIKTGWSGSRVYIDTLEYCGPR